MIRPTIFRKFLFATLVIALTPMLAVSLVLLAGVEEVRDRLALEIGSSSERMAAEGLQTRARQVAEAVTNFLHEREGDLLFLAGLDHNRPTLRHYYNSHRREVWEQTGPQQTKREIRERIPLYRSIAVLGADGQERLVIRDGRFLDTAELRNVARPEGTEYGNETYFREIRSLKPGQIYLSHVIGRHITIAEQAAGKRFNGVIRFGTPLFTPDGRFDGALVLSLDHRHLMEFTQHIDPGPGFVASAPTYESGNYAFLFDDQGWIITHPKLWDIRGLDPQGRPVPPYREQSGSAAIKAGRIPFNLDYAGFIHPNYPKVAEQVRLHHTGVSTLTNVGGARKIMAYAPIIYNRGVYQKHGIFGGVTIGYQATQFQEQALAGSQLISSQLKQYRTRSVLILSLAALLAGLAAWLLARGITKPLQRLNESARRLASDETGARVPVTGNDELADLALTFNAMVAELELRKHNLISTLDQLRESRQEILDERNFKESILESISSAITTFAPDGTLTSSNSTAHRFLGRRWPLESHYATVFAEWGALPARIARAFTEGIGYGRELQQISDHGSTRHFDVGIFPIGVNAELGLTVTLREETVREELREETLRLDRLASLGKLAAGIAHEIRNPLTGISLLLDDLHDRSHLSNDERELLRKALDEIERMERLITSLLSFAAPPRAELRAGDLTAVVASLVLLVRRPCEKQGVRLSVQLAEGLPTCRFDAEKLQQALLNLIKNALEAMPGGGELSIRVSHESDGNLISVSDSGAGIEPADLELVFEPFFTRKGAGTGLGLSITKRIVEEHGGTLSVTSNPSQGACFCIRLPVTG
ncbi:MAG: ATP-binding protein [Trichlorobacter sp.]|jgi:signal transduction histidine kinase